MLTNLYIILSNLYVSNSWDETISVLLRGRGHGTRSLIFANVKFIMNVDLLETRRGSETMLLHTTTSLSPRNARHLTLFHYQRMCWVYWLLLLEKFLRRVCTLCVALRAACNSPVLSNSVIKYAIQYAYLEQCCVIVWKTVPGTIAHNNDRRKLYAQHLDYVLIYKAFWIWRLPISKHIWLIVWLCVLYTMRSNDVISRRLLEYAHVKCRSL